MFKTKALGSLKSIFPPIHQPLPLNKHESQKLLNALTASFRAQLDKEHGWTYGTTTTQAASAVTYLPSAPVASSPKDVLARPTDRHLRAILNNPLFSSPDDTAAPASSPVAAVEDHNAVFHRAVSKGLMTIQRAHGFLLRVREDIQKSTTLSMRTGMQASGAGLLTLQWLRASGLERDLSFLKDRGFTKVLLQFMVAEGLDDLSWTWLNRLTKGEGPALIGNIPASACLLDSIVAAKAHAVELDDAYASILQGEAIFKQNAAPALNLFLAWRSLAWQTTGESWRHTNPSAGLFSAFIGLRKLMDRPMLMETAHLKLYDPTNPSAKRAIQFLTADNIRKKSQSAKTVKPLRRTEGLDVLPQFTKKITSLGLDTVQYLTKAGEFQEAQRILELLRQDIIIDTDPAFAV
ncbi:hypothetical protein B0T19DRAFT_426784 [Cercophora scortea]|uniref:Uncharacterized protein n=1 Tax=Cercophora scortea TaxID=314031 RepID=A0AAE0IEU3_9PEZI|nr:hypothetical protein B0T19DRAFT_426784 [Cercophora scortea]